MDRGVTIIGVDDVLNVCVLPERHRLTACGRIEDEQQRSMVRMR